METLRAPDIGDADSLLHVSVPSSSPQPAVWRKIGYPDIAAVFEEWYALADEVEIKLENQGTEDEYPVVSNAAAINAKCHALNRRPIPLVEDLPFTPNDITQVVCDMFAVDLRPEHKFKEHWIDHILNASGFAEYAPPLDKESLPHHEPFGWMTKRHVKALKAHG